MNYFSWLSRFLSTHFKMFSDCSLAHLMHHTHIIMSIVLTLSLFCTLSADSCVFISDPLFSLWCQCVCYSFFASFVFVFELIWHFKLGVKGRHPNSQFMTVVKTNWKNWIIMSVMTETNNIYIVNKPNRECLEKVVGTSN